MKPLLDKLNHALTTKDWRLVEEVRDRMEGLVEWPKPDIPLKHPWGGWGHTKEFDQELIDGLVDKTYTMRDMMVHRESD